MKKALYFILAAIPSLAFAQVIETRSVDAFTGIATSALVSVEVKSGAPCAVSLEGEAEGVNAILTTVKDGVLHIDADGKSKSGPIKVVVTVSNLKMLDIGGAAELVSSGALIADTLTVQGSGGSQLELSSVKASAIIVDFAGASSMKLCGTTNRLTVDLSGAAELDAACCEAQVVNIETSGASNARVSAATTIVAKASGASEIMIYGDATDRSIEATGAASIDSKAGSGANDTTHLRIGGRNFDISEDPDERSKREKKADDDDFETWEGLDFGINGLMTYDNQLVMPIGLKSMELNYVKSYVFGWNLFQKNIHLYRNNINLATGLGLTWYHYNLRGSYSFQPNVDYTFAAPDSLDYSRNRLNMCYANIPLYLEFNTNNTDASHSFHFGAGAQFGYNVFKNKLKQKYELEGKTYKRKIKDDFNVNPFKVDLIARIGYGSYTLFASYALTELFEKDKGPSLFPVTAGIHIDF